MIGVSVVGGCVVGSAVVVTGIAGRNPASLNCSSLCFKQNTKAHMYICQLARISGLGLRQLCSKFCRIFCSALPEKFSDYSFKKSKFHNIAQISIAT